MSDSYSSVMIGTALFFLLFMFACDPEGLGESARAVVDGFEGKETDE